MARRPAGYLGYMEMTPLEIRVARAIHDRRRRERLRDAAKVVALAVLLVLAMLGACGLLIFLFTLLAPSGAALPGLSG